MDNGHNSSLSEPHFQPVDPNYATFAVHKGHRSSDCLSKCVVPPIIMSSTFALDGPISVKSGEHTGYEYGRYGNPTRDALQRTLAALEGATYALAYSSGMAAVSSVGELLRPGDHAVAMSNIYGGSYKYFRDHAPVRGIDVSFYKGTDTEGIASLVRPDTKLVYAESPTNPTLQVVDLRKLAEAIHSKSKALLVVDNTFLTSYFQKPLSLGVDIVMYSCTKYINGHADVIMGALVTNHDDVYKNLKALHDGLGPSPSPFDCYLVLRGIVTLPLRMKQHMKNGLAVARFLQKHPAVEKVLHPGLECHPCHSLTLQQTSGHSGMLSFYIKGGEKEATVFLKSLQIFQIAQSLGVDMSLASLPAKMSHVFLNAEERERDGVTLNLIRLSVGLESPTDLIEDLDQALKAAVTL